MGFPRIIFCLQPWTKMLNIKIFINCLMTHSGEREQGSSFILLCSEIWSSMIAYPKICWTNMWIFHSTCIFTSEAMNYHKIASLLCSLPILAIICISTGQARNYHKITRLLCRTPFLSLNELSLIKWLHDTNICLAKPPQQCQSLRMAEFWLHKKLHTGWPSIETMHHIMLLVMQFDFVSFLLVLE